MDENLGQRISAIRLGDEVDRLRNLPESLLFEILLKLKTKDVVKTSVLSTSWRNLWKFVPGLNLRYGRDFTDYDDFVTFMDEFLGFNSESCLRNFKFKFQHQTPKAVDYTRWINNVIERKVRNLHVCDRTMFWDKLSIPTTVYTCESLVSLKIYKKILPRPEFVSLPCLKVLVLDTVQFSKLADDLAFEMIISSCPVLESLTVRKCCFAKFLLVCSQSLLSFTYDRHCLAQDLVVAIDAPRLEYLKLNDHVTRSCMIDSPGSIVKADINSSFRLSSGEENDCLDFLIGISTAKVLKISSLTLEAISKYSRCEPLPLFGNLSFLHVDFRDYYWDVLPKFLESCPNLKSLSLDFSKLFQRRERVFIVPESTQLLTSLESVKIVKPMLEEATHMKLVSYFLQNSPILKKFTFFVDDFIKNEESIFLKKLNAIPRLSSSCEFFLA